MVRRFNFLKENEKDWVSDEDRKVKKENQIPRLKMFCLKTLEARAVENFSMVIISAYTLFILFDLTLSEALEIDANLLAQIDLVFLTVFFIEIILKTFASNGMYLADFFNCFDAIIVAVSEVLILNGIIAKGLGVLRLIRVVVITIRKITGNQSKLRH